MTHRKLPRVTSPLRTEVTCHNLGGQPGKARLRIQARSIAPIDRIDNRANLTAHHFLAFSVA